MARSVRAGHQLVIVALPSEDDPIRKISSEKEPHLTLLYLGENNFDAEGLAHIAQYVQHAASLMNQFGLDVESRGELGDKRADVLFFNKKWSKNIADFRAQLLRDDLISTAYQSAEQFPGWLPHLTLGSPETPAKKNEQEYSPSYVHFDRVALWTEDYSGPTFQLKPYEFDSEVAMSQREQGRSVTSDILKHYGVKGMKWGKRRTQSELDTASADAKSAAAAREKINTTGTKSLSNQELQGLITRMNLESQYRNLSAQKSDLDKGLSATQKVLKVGTSVENVRKFLETPTGKAVKIGLKAAFAGAKVAAAGHTGGASAAAAAGAGIAVRRMGNHYTNVGR